MAKKQASPAASQSFLASAALEVDDSKRQTRMIHAFTAVLVTYDLVYGAYWLRNGDPNFGAILVSCGFIQLASWMAFLKHRRAGLAKPALTVASIVSLVALLIGGGIERTGIYFMFIFPPLTYLLQGVRAGLLYNIAFFLALLGVAAANARGLVSVPYSAIELREMWSTLLCMNLLGYFAESGWDQSRRLLAERTERFRTLVAELPIGVMMIEKNGSISATNSEFRRLMGADLDIKGNLYAPSKFQVLHEDGTEYNADEIPTRRVLATGKPVTRETVFVRRPDGVKVTLRVSAAPIKDGADRVIASVAAYEDMTQDYEVDRAKSEFISIASHQLKTPLTSIKWAVETLLDGESGQLGDKQGAAVAEIGKITERLLRTIGDFLSVSRIESRTNQARRQASVEVVAVLTDVMRAAEAEGVPRRVAVSLEKAPERFVAKMAEPDFREVMSNLVSNAVKYSLDGGRVSLRITTVSGPNRAMITVKDNGIGIPSAEAGRVYDKFFRASNVSREIEGTGLGMYIVKSLVEKAGGRVSFVSEEGRGTEFTIELQEAEQA